MLDYNSPQEISKVLAERGLSPQKRFGQNFMINPGARSQIVDLLNLQPGDLVWEIGPGLGALSVEIIKRGAKLRIFEIDRGYIEYLKDTVMVDAPVDMTEGDALKTWKLYRDEPVTAIMGNLPYNVGTAMIAQFLEAGFLRPMVFTVQKEVAERMRAKPSDKNYGSFSVFCQTFTTVTMPLVLRPGSFFPAPEVTSAVVLMVPRTDRPDIGSPEIFDQLLRALFSSRRKTIRNNLRQSTFATTLGLEACLELLTKVGHQPEDRAETMKPATMAELSRLLTIALGRT